MTSPEFPSQEYRIIERLKQYLNYTPDSRFPTGIGDDAVVRVCEKEQLILTADSFVENVHFSFGYMSPQEIGYKALVINLSDCAAMGAVPDSALVQVIFPDIQDKQAVESILLGIYEGMHKACVSWNFPIVGGNLSKGPAWIVAVSLTGRKESSERILTRTGARKGDGVWVTGVCGKSAAGLSALKKWGRKNVPGEYAGLIRAHIQPVPRIHAGLQLSKDRAVHAVIDLSDGIAKECHTICYENSVGIALQPAEGYLLPEMEQLSSLSGVAREEWFLYGGEDYELLFTAAEDFNPRKYGDFDLYKIGSVTDCQNRVEFIDHDGNQMVVGKKAWDHLAP